VVTSRVGNGLLVFGRFRAAHPSRQGRFRPLQSLFWGRDNLWQLRFDRRPGRSAASLGGCNREQFLS
jgi:hypothetical protein